MGRPLANSSHRQSGAAHLKPRRIGRLEVHNVAGETTSSLIVREDERLLVDEVDEASANSHARLEHSGEVAVEEKLWH